MDLGIEEVRVARHKIAARPAHFLKHFPVNDRILSLHR